MRREYTDQSDIETAEDAREYLVMVAPGECAAAIEERVEAGVDGFQCRFVAFLDTSGMELFADEVTPECA